MNITTVEQLKKAVTPELIAAARNFFAATELEKRLTPVITQIQKDVLKRGQWKVAKEWANNIFEEENQDVILNPDRAYLMEDRDYAEYIASLEEAYKEAGFNVEPGHCPLLDAKNAIAKAKSNIAKELEPITGIKLEELLYSGFDTYERYIDLNLRYLVSFVK